MVQRNNVICSMYPYCMYVYILYIYIHVYTSVHRSYISQRDKMHWYTKIHLFETISKWQFLYRRNIEIKDGTERYGWCMHCRLLCTKNFTMPLPSEISWMQGSHFKYGFRPVLIRIKKNRSNSHVSTERYSTAWVSVVWFGKGCPYELNEWNLQCLYRNWIQSKTYSCLRSIHLWFSPRSPNLKFFLQHLAFSFT